LPGFPGLDTVVPPEPQEKEHVSFTVDPDSLDKFADLQMHYFEDASALGEFMRDETEMSLHGEGVFSYLLRGHQSIVKMMSDRIELMRRIGLDSVKELGSAADFYRGTDEANAIELEKAYDEVPPHKDDKARKGPPEEANFKHLDAQDKLDITKDPSDIEPKGYAVDNWVRTELDVLSLTANVRKVIESICKVDPIDWVRQWMSGDWEAWAKASLAWGACAKSTEVMGENLWRATAALDEVWDGRAGDAAVAFFEQLRDATYTEVIAYEGLQVRYKLYMELVYENHLILNDVLNTMIDVVIELLLVVPAVFKAPFDDGGTLLQTVLALLGEIGMIYTIVVDACRLFESMGQAFALPEVPETELRKPTTQDESHGYQHPEPSV
jgi:hypothetical protein